MYVITGGPGVGKTTLIDILRKEHGMDVLPEVATVIIGEEIQRDGDCLPWKNVGYFQGEVAQRQYLQEQRAPENAFLDRSMIDGAAYCKLAGIPPASLVSSLDTRYKKVFLLDRLPRFENSEIRTETEAEAQQLHEAIISVYGEHGYELDFVPVMSPLDRAQYILERI